MSLSLSPLLRNLRLSGSLAVMSDPFLDVGEVVPDARGRVALGSVVLAKRYRVSVAADGEIRLLPLVSLSVEDFKQLDC